MGDWKACMKMDQKDTTQRIFQLFTVSLSAPGVVQSNLRVHMPVWGWEVRIGAVEESLSWASCVKPKTASTPFCFGKCELIELMKRNGPIMADLICGRLIVILALLNQSLSRAKRSSSLIPRWHDEAQYGRNRPVGLDDKETCRFCGYRTLCYGKIPPFHPIRREQDILDSALEQLTNEPMQKRVYPISRERFSKEATNA